MTVAADRITQNLLRSQDWPGGEYVGWEPNSASFRDLLEVVGPMFSDLTIRRAGLRYINRMVIDKEADLENWFTVAPAPLELVRKLWDFTFTRTWESGIEFPQHSATVTLAKSDPPKDVVEDMLGVTLDIDIFNLWVKDAPDFDAVPEWFERAHLFEKGSSRAALRALSRCNSSPWRTDGDFRCPAFQVRVLVSAQAVSAQAQSDVHLVQGCPRAGRVPGNPADQRT